METAVNYLLCRHTRDTSPIKDGYVKYAVMGTGLAIGGGAIGYAINSIRSAVTQENAQYCGNRATALLAEVQKQIQIFNASCVIDDPGANMSRCNTKLLPQPFNTSCPDIISPSFGSYLPTIILTAGVTTFAFLMARSIMTSYDQRNELLRRISLMDETVSYETIEHREPTSSDLGHLGTDL